MLSTFLSEKNLYFQTKNFCKCTRNLNEQINREEFWQISHYVPLKIISTKRIIYSRWPHNTMVIRTPNTIFHGNVRATVTLTQDSSSV